MADINYGSNIALGIRANLLALIPTADLVCCRSPEHIADSFTPYSSLGSLCQRRYIGDAAVGLCTSDRSGKLIRPIPTAAMSDTDIEPRRRTGNSIP